MLYRPEKSVLTNPFVETIDAIFDILVRDFNYRDVMRYLKGSFAGITKEQADVTDNFILASGIRGHKKWDMEWESGYIYRRRTEESKKYADEVLEIVREKVVSLLMPLYSELAQKKHTVRHFAEVFCEFMDEQDYYQVLMEKASEFTKRES